MKNKILMAAAFVIIFGAAQAEDKILETFKDKNGNVIETITAADVEEEIANLPDEYKQYYDSEDGRIKMLENIETQRLLKLDGIESGIEKNEEYKKELEKIKEKLLAKYTFTEKVSKTIEVSDDEAVNEYETTKENYKTQEEAKAAHILVKFPENAAEADKAKLKEKAEGILKDALSGKDFGELAKANSDDGNASEGGELGWFGKGQMVPEFEEAVFSCEKGKIVPKVVETQYGYHVVMVEDKKEAGYAAFEDAKAEIVQGLKNKKLTEKFKAYIENMKKIYVK